MNRDTPPPGRSDGDLPAIWPALALPAGIGLLVLLPLRAKGFEVDWLGTLRSLALELAPVAGIAALVRMAAVRLGYGGKRPAGRGEWLRWGGDVLMGIGSIALLGTVYCWAKVLIPLFNPRNCDAALARLDVACHLGLDPVAVAQGLFEGAGRFASLVDAVYGQYVAIVLGATAWLLASPVPGDRRRFLRGFVLVWLLGLALYWAVPALGPALVFPDAAKGAARLTPDAFGSQRVLLQNRQAVFRALAGERVPFVPFFGVAAMPSLHVAVPFFLFLFAAERRSLLRTPLLVVVLFMFLGAPLTGWHYAVDAWAGLLVGLVCWGAVRCPSVPRSVESPNV
jgi:hypothetical protein